jgi:hypothetical protein
MSRPGSSSLTRVSVLVLLSACTSSQSDGDDMLMTGTAGTGLAGTGVVAGDGAGTGAAGTIAGAGVAGTGVAGTGTAGTTAFPDAGGELDLDAALGDGAAGDAAVLPPRPKPPCLTKPSQVALLGDSYINWVSHSFPADLFKEAGNTFRNYAVGAYSMGSGGIGFIPPQLDEAYAEDPDLKFIVMSGGGNDILVPDTVMFPRGGDCKMSQMSPMIADCQKIVDKALDAAEEMLDTGISYGIEHVVYFFYPNVPEGTLVGGLFPNAILEYAAPRVKEFCDTTFERTGGKASCYFVDLRPAFKGHPEYFAPTDIHPNTVGSAVMAKEVWKVMKDNCVAQPASSCCCEP